MCHRFISYVNSKFASTPVARRSLMKPRIVVVVLDPQSCSHNPFSVRAPLWFLCSRWAEICQEVSALNVYKPNLRPSISLKWPSKVNNSSEMLLFHKAHLISYYRSIVGPNYGPILYRFPYSQILLENCEIYIPHLSSTSPQGDPVEILQRCLVGLLGKL